jgi:hypothetical protein
LPQATRDPNRKFAYVNSLCLAFLVIGALGIKTPIFVQKPLPEIVEYVPVEILNPPVEEAPPDQPTDAPPDTSLPPPDLPSDAPVVATVVAADASAVAFPVPVEGPVILAPARFASAPPAITTRPRVASAPVLAPVRFVPGANEQGSFPAPPYVSGTLRSGDSAVVELYLEVNERGSIVKCDVNKTCGSFELDRKTTQYVRYHWRFPSGEYRRYTVEIQFNVK